MMSLCSTDFTPPTHHETSKVTTTTTTTTTIILEYTISASLNVIATRFFRLAQGGEPWSLLYAFILEFLLLSITGGGGARRGELHQPRASKRNE